MVPQIYWEIGHGAADYETLINWWNQQVSDDHLYIGHDVERTLKAKDLANPKKNQLPRKMELSRNLTNVKGNCLFYGVAVMKNQEGILDSLSRNYHQYPSLIPPITHVIKKKLPREPKKLSVQKSHNTYKLIWNVKKEKELLDNPLYYCVYRFNDKEDVNLDDVRKIVKITRDMEYVLPYVNGRTNYKYVVTSVDRLHNESKKGKVKEVKL